MDKKPLMVVSICAVVLLVLGSLSNVVGYQTVEPTTVNDSPLFQTRTQRATNQQQNSITSLYLGMGGESHLQFLIRDNKTEQMKKAVDIISKMDDKSFGRFTKLCIQKARQDKSLRDISCYQIIQALLLLKTKPDTIMYFFANRNNQGGRTGGPTYCGGPYTVCGDWSPGCWILTIIIALFEFLIILPIIGILNSFTLVWCEPILN